MAVLISQKRPIDKPCLKIDRIFKGLTITAVLCSLFNLSGCAQLGINKQEVGAVTGAAVGGLVGSRFGQGNGKIAAAIGGTILGGVIGGAIGHSMDQTDQLKMNSAIENASTQETVRWKNPDTGRQYSLTPIKTYYNNQQPCREYHLNATIGGEVKQVYGRACRIYDGHWKIVN